MGIDTIVLWVKTYVPSIVHTITGIIAIASVIVKYTPTLKDDDCLLKVIKFLGKYIALNRTVDDRAIRNAKK